MIHYEGAIYYYMSLPPDRAKRLKALGNAVVPIQALPFFEAITWMDHIAKEEGEEWKPNFMNS